VPMAAPKLASRAIPVAPPCVPDLTFSCTGSSKHCPRIPEPIQEAPHYLNHSPKKSTTARVTFAGCDSVQEADEMLPSPPPPPPQQAQGESKERKQPEGREISHQDNVEGMLDRISHDLDYLLSRSGGSGGSSETEASKKQQAPLRSALKKTNKTVKIREPTSIIFISSDSCDP
jgi:hypothetical protein